MNSRHALWTRFVLVASVVSLVALVAHAKEIAHDKSGKTVKDKGAIYGFDDQVDWKEVAATLREAKEQKRKIYLFSGDMNCDKAHARPVGDDIDTAAAVFELQVPYDKEKHAALDWPKDESKWAEPADDFNDKHDATKVPDGKGTDETEQAEPQRKMAPEQDIFIESAVDEAVLKDMAPEVKDAVAHDTAVAIFAFCKSNDWLTKAKDKAGKPLFFQ